MKFNKFLLVKLLAEFLASFLVQFVGCATPSLLKRKDKDGNLDFISPMTSLTVNPLEANSNVANIDLSVNPVIYAFAWGGAVLAATGIFRIISGAHINPCVTMAAFILGIVDIFEGLLYIIAQFSGTGVGFILSYLLFKDSGNVEKFFCLTAITIDPWWKSFFIEFLMTGAWVLAMCSSWHESNETMLESISLRIGLIVVACNLAGGIYTGASMNPFRSIFPIIFSGYFRYFFVYITIPPAAALVVALAWRFIYQMGENENLA